MDANKLVTIESYINNNFPAMSDADKSKLSTFVHQLCARAVKENVERVRVSLSQHAGDRDILHIGYEWRALQCKGTGGVPCTLKRLDGGRINTLFTMLVKECTEWHDAAVNLSAADILKELCDIAVVLTEAILEGGFGAVFYDALKSVQVSNLSKAGPDGVLSYDRSGKIEKGPTYKEPDIESIINYFLETIDVEGGIEFNGQGGGGEYSDE